MVNFGTPFGSSTFSRVSSVLSRNVLLGNMRNNERGILRLQEQLATGFEIIRPSDDPLGANRVQSFTLGLRRNAQFQRNIETSSARLAISDASLGGAGEFIIRAREILLSQVGGTAGEETRRASAREVDQLLEGALSQANARFHGKFIFAGSRTDRAPFAVLGSDVLFTGDLERLKTDVSDGLRTSGNLSADVFGAVSDDMRGLDVTTLLPINLDPRVSANTRIADLNGGRGAVLGSIEIAGSSGTAIVNLRGAERVSDLVDLINARTAVTGVTAAVKDPGDPVGGANGIKLTDGPAGPVTVVETLNGITARDLGLLSPPASQVGGTYFGGDLDPRLSGATGVDDLLAGAGLDADGIVVTNASATQTFTETFGASVFGPGATVEQVLNALNNSGVHVLARINAEGTGIDVLSRLSGARLTIAENGGTTADQLGLRSRLERAKIVDLNGGHGAATVSGADLRITKRDGTQIFIDVDNAVHLQELLSAISADPDLTATVNALDQIVITDTSVGAGALTVENTGGSFAATNLGIEGSAPATLTGTTIASAGSQVEGIFSALIRLRDALDRNDPAAMDIAGRLLDAAQERILDARADTGAVLSGLELAQNRLGLENLELEKLRNSTRDADFAEIAARLTTQQTVFQASLAVAARILETTLLDFL